MSTNKGVLSYLNFFPISLLILIARRTCVCFCYLFNCAYLKSFVMVITMMMMWHAYAGDPTTFGNLPLDEVIEDAVVDSVRSKKRNGYAPSVG